MGYRELLRTQPAFRKLWFGQIVSELGDWLQIIALLALFPTQGAAVERLAGVFIVRMLPSIVWAPLAGVVADRFPRGQVMVACDLGRAVIVLGYLLIRGPEDVIWIYALLFAQETLSSFFEPARAAALPQTVEPHARFAANALSNMTWSAMLALGAALGGLIAAGVGPRAAFVIDAASFLLSAVFIGGIGIPRVVRDAAGAAAHARDRFGLFALREGFAYLRAHRAQASAALTKGLWGMSGGVIFLFSIYAGERFTPPGHASSSTTGLLFAGRGLGALLGPLLTRRLFGESSAGLRRAIQFAFPLALLAITAFAFAPNAWLGALCLVFVHAGGSTCWVNSSQLLQLTVPNQLLGRVVAVELAAFTFTTALSNAFAGAALGHRWLDLRGVTFAMAFAAALSALVWWVAMRRVGARLDAAAAEHGRSTALSATSKDAL
jgi:MFS family permease